MKRLTTTVVRKRALLHPFIHWCQPYGCKSCANCPSSCWIKCLVWSTSTSRQSMTESKFLEGETSRFWPVDVRNPTGSAVNRVLRDNRLWKKKKFDDRIGTWLKAQELSFHFFFLTASCLISKRKTVIERRTKERSPLHLAFVQLLNVGCGCDCFSSGCEHCNVLDCGSVYCFVFPVWEESKKLVKWTSKIC